VAGTVIALQAAGLVEGRMKLVALGLAVLAVPTSRELSRRVLIAGALFLGWVPFLWWWDVQFGIVGRSGVVLAVLLGGLAAWLAAAPRPASRAWSVVPRVRWTDAVAGAGVALATWVYLPLLRVPSGQTALSGFLRGWDNSAHFDMTEMIRRHGSLISRTAIGSAGRWSYDDYPQGYHAATATVMEVLGGVRVGAPAAELTHYMQAMALVVIVSVATVVAGLCALPALRRRPLLALPLVMLVVATFTLGPGGMVLHNGFPNFFVACALLACLPLLVIPMTRPGPPVLLAALGGAAVGVMHNWSFLMTMGGFALVAAFFPWRRSRWPRTLREWVRLAGIGLVTLVGVGAAWGMLRQQGSVTNLLLLAGGVTPISLSMLCVSITVSLALSVAAWTSRAHGPQAWRGDIARTAMTGLLPAAGALVTGLVAYLQISRAGGPGYYMWKYAIALQLLTVVVIAATIPTLIRRFPAKRLRTRAVAVVASCAAAVGAIQFYGLPATLPTALGTSVSPGGAARADSVALAKSPASDAGMVLAAAAANVSGSDVPYVLLPFPSAPLYPAAGSTPPMMLAQWFNALTGRWTERGNNLLRYIPVPAYQRSTSSRQVRARNRSRRHRRRRSGIRRDRAGRCQG
jgi:hypothetical protein